MVTCVINRSYLILKYVTFLCHPPNISLTIEFDYFSSSLTAVEQLEESGWLDRAVCPMTPDICHQIIAKYFCFLLMCFTFIGVYEYSVFLLCWTESEQIYHRGRYDWPVLPFQPRHSHVLSKAKPRNRSLIKTYITAQQMLSVTVSLSITAAALISSNESPWNHSARSWFSTCGEFNFQDFFFFFFPCKLRYLVPILASTPTP